MDENDRQFEFWMKPIRVGPAFSTVQPNSESESPMAQAGRAARTAPDALPTNRSLIPIVRSNSGSDRVRRLPPTLEASAELQFAYSRMNDALFGGELPDCQITYTRQKNIAGHFWPDRFERAKGEFCHELALNPFFLAMRPDRDSLSTIVHESVHVWRHDFGPRNRRGGRGANGYHDLPWAEKMESVGLMPSDTGLPGGKKTGYRMSHIIIEGGPFDIACRALLATGFRINWHDRLCFQSAVAPRPDDDDDTPVPGKKDRIKFTCRACKLNAWAKPSSRLTCTNCDLVMSPAGTSLPMRRPR